MFCFPAAAAAAADSGWMIPVGAVILWSTATADTLKIRDYCSGIHGAVTFQDINKSIPTISAWAASRGPEKGSGERCVLAGDGPLCTDGCGACTPGVSEQLLS